MYFRGLWYHIHMPTFKFSKLVRDKIVDQQIASGAKPTYHRLGLEDHKHELINKLIEEAREIDQASLEEVVAEIADIQQVIDDLRELHGLTVEDVAAAQNLKNRKSGAFKEGMYVEFVEVDENNQWADYYRRNSDRYTEM